MKKMSRFLLQTLLLISFLSCTSKPDYKPGDCVIKPDETRSDKVVKISGIAQGEYSVNSYFYSGKKLEIDNNARKVPVAELDEKYVIIPCPRL